jgi:hypothetical protein
MGIFGDVVLLVGEAEAMTKLSPKAMRFVDIAMRDMGPAEKRIWASVDRAPASKLSVEAAEVALAALGHYETFVRNRLSVVRSEDEVSDLSNDLGFICAIERDLIKARRRRGA